MPGYDLRVKFEVKQASVQTPNYAIIEIFNLADSTVANAIFEYDYIVLEAGYVNGQFGTIFAGQIKQFEKGHLSATDSFLRIFAADGDQAITQSIVNQTLPSGTTAQQKNDAIANSFKENGVSKGYIDPAALVIPPNIRESVLFGQSADEMRDLAAQNGARWTINDNKLVLMKSMAYAPGDIVKLNKNSGLVGWPTATQDGIYVTCLINSSIRLGQRVQLDNKQINQFNVPGGGPASGVNFPGFTDTTSIAQLSTDGIYAVLVIEYSGDSRGNEWYQHMVALAVDSTVGQQSSVKSGETQSLPAFPRAADAVSFAAGRS